VNALATAGAAPRTLDPERLGDHRDRLYRAALGLCGSHADADDLVQDTCLQVLGKPRRLHSGDDVGYLMRALRNAFYSRQRAWTRRPCVHELAEHQELPDARSTGQPQSMAETREVLAAVASLSEPYRGAIAAVDLVGLSYSEAARALGTAEGTIMSRLFRGRAQAARRLDG
jgi:RNA polymerase sigma-70 factor (ECF subfamily)